MRKKGLYKQMNAEIKLCSLVCCINHVYQSLTFSLYIRILVLPLFCPPFNIPGDCSFTYYVFKSSFCISSLLCHFFHISSWCFSAIDCSGWEWCAESLVSNHWPWLWDRHCLVWFRERSTHQWGFWRGHLECECAKFSTPIKQCPD